MGTDREARLEAALAPFAAKVHADGVDAPYPEEEWVPLLVAAKKALEAEATPEPPTPETQDTGAMATEWEAAIRNAIHRHPARAVAALDVSVLLTALDAARADRDALTAQIAAKAADQPTLLDIAVDIVRHEVQRATSKFPTWPTDPLHALSVVGEEFGELTKAVVQQTYEPHKNAPGELRKEAIQTAAMALRFVMSLDAYEVAPAPQHPQLAATEGGTHD